MQDFAATQIQFYCEKQKMVKDKKIDLLLFTFCISFYFFDIIKKWKTLFQIAVKFIYLKNSNTFFQKFLDLLKWEFYSMIK